MARPSLHSFFTVHFSSIVINGSLILVGLILAAPLLQNAWLCSDDGALHVYRTVALDRALSDGLIYPRWFPDLAYGYGFPFFNYREPLGYYLIEFAHVLGASFPLALNLVLAGSLIAGGLTMNLWVSDIFDRPAGFVAALVYLAAPYTIIDALTRSNLPESIALALMPLILWAFRRLLLHGGRKYFAGAVLSLAALLLTHNISSLIFVPVLVAYSLWLIAYRALPGSARAVRHAMREALFALGLALALTAFFWLPALTEGQSAQLYLTHSARGNDYHFNFATVAEVFGPPGSSEPALLNPPLRIVLGWAQIALAVLGASLIKRLTTRERRAHVIVAVVAAVLFIGMALPVSLPLWDTLPLIRFVQFPWRFVGRAILPMALLAGAAAYAVFHASPRRIPQPVSRLTRYHEVPRWGLLLALFTLPVLLSVVPLLYPRVCSGPLDVNINSVYAYEHATGHIGVDPLGAYLPATVIERPVGSPLEAQYAAHEPIKRFDRSTLPEAAQLISEAYSPNRAEMVIDTSRPFHATYLTFDFPGWHVAIDDQPVSIVPSHPHGLITFEVPAGRHAISVSFEDTPARTLANMTSLAALVVFLGVLVRRPHPKLFPLDEPPAIDAGEVDSRSMVHRMNSLADTVKPDSSGFSFILVPIVFLLLKMLLIDPQLTPLRQTQLQQGAVQNVQTPLQVDYGDQLRLLGYRLISGSVPSGETVRVDLYWRALRPIEKNYQTTVGLVDAQGEVWSPKTLERPRDYQDYPATNTWPADAYVVDSFELPVNPGTPPGTYAIFAEVFERSSSLLPLPAQASAARPSSRPWAAQIGSLAITPATRSFAAQELGIYNLQVEQPVTPEIKLIGANRDRDDVLAGETVLLTLFWQAGQKPAQDYAATIELISAQNQAVLRREFPLGAGRYPTTQWNVNEQIVDLDRVRVPIDLAEGIYRWRVSIGNGEPIGLGDLRVAAPDRLFAVPPIAHALNQTLSERVTLLGVETSHCEARGEDCHVKLWWRAEQDIPESYKVFVHLRDMNGVPRAQADMIPVNGARPTWSWLPGEILADELVVKIPADLSAGRYRLTTGLYHELDGVRLTLPDGVDAIELTTINLR